MDSNVHLIEEIKKISDNYIKLKSKFSEFYELAFKFSDKDSRGIVFEPQLEKNYFDVRFSGKCIRILFSIFRDGKDCYGLVEASSMNPRTLIPLNYIGEFRFGTHGRTNVMLEDESEGILINTDVSAPHLLNVFLYDSLLKT